MYYTRVMVNDEGKMLSYIAGKSNMLWIKMFEDILVEPNRSTFTVMSTSRSKKNREPVLNSKQKNCASAA